MNTLLVWILISTGGQYSGLITYSPPMAILEECQRVKQVVDDTNVGYKFKSRCIQMTIVK